eukprot:GHVS01088841.1.p1 GENE.GHVS01088841.1~~GHVS01088841.1.p1  ORF type:complete len:260 (+),score=13.31 GHVS01088841.1:33-782(+)
MEDCLKYFKEEAFYFGLIPPSNGNVFHEAGYRTVVKKTLSNGLFTWPENEKMVDANHELVKSQWSRYVDAKVGKYTPWTVAFYPVDSKDSMTVPIMTSVRIMLKHKTFQCVKGKAHRVDVFESLQEIGQALKYVFGEGRNKKTSAYDEKYELVQLGDLEGYNSISFVPLVPMSREPMGLTDETMTDDCGGMTIYGLKTELFQKRLSSEKAQNEKKCRMEKVKTGSFLSQIYIELKGVQLSIEVRNGLRR